MFCIMIFIKLINVIFKKSCIVCRESDDYVFMKVLNYSRRMGDLIKTLNREKLEELLHVVIGRVVN